MEPLCVPHVLFVFKSQKRPCFHKRLAKMLITVKIIDSSIITSGIHAANLLAVCLCYQCNLSHLVTSATGRLVINSESA